MQHPWTGDRGKYLICVDSYHDSILKGRIISPHWETESFSGLVQFLLKMEALLEHTQQPQAFTEPRKFSLMLHLDAQPASAPRKKGSGTTFELKILFRQHTSWQGILLWKEKRISHNFRSVLELVILIDSALRSAENSGCA